MPGVFEMSLDVPISRAIEDILLLAECSREGRMVWANTLPCLVK